MPLGGSNDGPEVDEAKEAEDLAFKELDGFSLEQVIQAGHEAVLRRLVAKVKAGTASHQEMAILRNLLRDNGMVLATPPGTDLPKPEAPADLPTFDRPDYE